MTGERTVLGLMGVYLLILGLELEPFELELDRLDEPEVLDFERLLDPDELDFERRLVAASDNSTIKRAMENRTRTVVILIVSLLALSGSVLC